MATSNKQQPTYVKVSLLEAFENPSDKYLFKAQDGTPYQVIEIKTKSGQENKLVVRCQSEGGIGKSFTCDRLREVEKVVFPAAKKTSKKNGDEEKPTQEKEVAARVEPQQQKHWFDKIMDILDKDQSNEAYEIKGKLANLEKEMKQYLINKLHAQANKGKQSPVVASTPKDQPKTQSVAKSTKTEKVSAATKSKKPDSKPEKATVSPQEKIDYLKAQKQYVQDHGVDAAIAHYGFSDGSTIRVNLLALELLEKSEKLTQAYLNKTSGVTWSNIRNAGQHIMSKAKKHGQNKVLNLARKVARGQMTVQEAKSELESA